MAADGHAASNSHAAAYITTSLKTAPFINNEHNGLVRYTMALLMPLTEGESRSAEWMRPLIALIVSESWDDQGAHLLVEGD